MALRTKSEVTTPWSVTSVTRPFAAYDTARAVVGRTSIRKSARTAFQKTDSYTLRRIPRRTSSEPGAGKT
ncbi:hypothetical protein [Paractinoplanes brasiliensis]|uniref:Uncharacterized protein n=1 Tax=Paractinoplanes brasiliensis TaxID=52695 RepID=A0A4R6JLA9_9ACTN|nr:hypothetical protein [Actinoplanes brasiliensis]TDO37123.1 hypothetical protein C8E87_0721 [Actinoplanes brasiliensis]